MRTPSTPDLRPFLLVGAIAVACTESGDYPGSTIGPERGHLYLSGGGGGTYSPFLDRCGRQATIVHITTAAPDGHLAVAAPGAWQAVLAERHGLSDLRVLHTRDPSVSDQDGFVAAFDEADCVWFGGGRQWRLADAYLDTAVHDALEEVLDRGGWVGGDSAGATMLADFLVRGDTSGNAIMIGDHTRGFGLLRGAAVDQHVAERGRQLDLVEVLEARPDLLGIGLDERTWVEVHGQSMRIGGTGSVWVHDRARWPRRGATRLRHVIRLQRGTRFDLENRTVIPED